MSNNKNLIYKTTKQIQDEIANKTNEDLMNIKKDIEAQMHQYYYCYNKCKNIISELNSNILNKCNHIWLIDTTACSEYTEYYCDTCGLTK
jgi:hypothetical protein